MAMTLSPDVQITLYLIRVSLLGHQQTQCWQQSCTWFLLNCFLYFGSADNVIQMTDENSQHFQFLNPSLTTMTSHLHYPRDQSRYAPSPWETSLHCNDVPHWLGAYLDWSLLSILYRSCWSILRSHSKEESSPYFLVTKSKQGMISMG